MLMFDYQNYYASRFVGVSNECDPSTYPVESTLCPLDKEAASVMFPVNPETGNVVDLLTRLMRTENQLERSQILSLLSDNGADSPFAKLDDDTKLSLLKPRSLQSFDEIASFRDVCLKAISEFNENGTDGSGTGTDGSGTGTDGSGTGTDGSGTGTDVSGTAS